MNFTPLDWLGIVAGSLTTISFIPQVLRILRTRSADDISGGMFAVFAGGTSLWIVWGALQRAMPVIIANAVTLILAFAILMLKWRYARPAAAAVRVRLEPRLNPLGPETSRRT
jgi:MtN3 and saliva related transmembrane protein